MNVPNNRIQSITTITMTALESISEIDTVRPHKYFPCSHSDIYRYDYDLRRYHHVDMDLMYKKCYQVNKKQVCTECLDVQNIFNPTVKLI